MQEGRPQGLSVVIPTRGRSSLVERALATIEEDRHQMAEPEAIEVVVVDDTPEPERQRIIGACRRYDTTRYLAGPRRVGMKRNLGAEAARHDYVVFLDSDCSVAPGFLHAHLEAGAKLRTEGGQQIGATAGPTVLEGPPPTWWWQVADYSAIYDAPYDWPRRYAEVYWAATSNLGMRKSVLTAIGGFDEDTFTVVGGEDVELCLRLRERGYTIACAPGAVAVHARSHIRSLADMLRKMFLYGRTSAYITTRHPKHAEPFANPVSFLAATILLLAPLKNVRWTVAVAAAATGAWWLRDAAALMRYRGDRRAHLALPAVLMEWTFSAGIVAEAVSHLDPRWLIQRFRYFDRSYFRPLPAQPGAVPELDRSISS